MFSFPFPLYAAEMKIHPSRERVNLNELPDFEMAATSSSSETRLFRFFSPENTTVPSPRADSQTQIDNRIAQIRGSVHGEPAFRLERPIPARGFRLLPSQRAFRCANQFIDAIAQRSIRFIPAALNEFSRSRECEAPAEPCERLPHSKRSRPEIVQDRLERAADRFYGIGRSMLSFWTTPLLPS